MEVQWGAVDPRNKKMWKSPCPKLKNKMAFSEKDDGIVPKNKMAMGLAFD